MHTENLIPLALLRRELAACICSETGLPEYRALLDGALNGKFPAERIRGRWYAKKADVLVIAERLGLAPAAPAKPAQRSRKASVSPQLASAA